MPVPTDPQGGPVFGSTSTPVGASAYTLWDVPKDLIDYLDQTSGGKLWFDIGQRTTTQTLVGGQNPVSEPGLVGAKGGIEYEPGSATAAEHDVTTSRKGEAYDIYSKPWQIMAQFQAMQYNDPARFLELQHALAAGPFGHVNINGVFDQNTEAALGHAMMQYVKLSMGTGVAPIYTDPKTGKKSGGFVAYLLNAASTTQANGGAGSSIGGGAGSITLADPAQIRDAAQNAAQAALGQGLSEKELNAFVQEFQANQLANQTDPYTQQTKLPAEAMAFVQKNNPGEYKANQRMAFLDQLVNLLGGKRPDMQPTPSIT